MDTPQFELSVSKIEDAIVHFLVVGDHEMVGQLCKLWLECKWAKSNHIGPPNLGGSSNISSLGYLVGPNTEYSCCGTSAKIESERPSANRTILGVS